MGFMVGFCTQIIALAVMAFLFHLFAEWLEHAVPGFGDVKQVEVINLSDLQPPPLEVPERGK